MSDEIRKLAYQTPPETDLTRWRLSCAKGRQKWYYVAEGEECDREQSALEAYYLNLDTSKFFPDLPKSRTAQEALLKGINVFSHLQADEGFWPGECAGILTITPAILFACYAAKISLPEAVNKELLRYILSKQLPDGGWGSHLKEDSTISGTVFNYIAMRMLGLGPDHPDIVRARICLHKKGGAIGIVYYGKIWLAVLNLYSWEGLNAQMPELWLLPSWMPGHPTTYWCHTRQISLLLTFCYAKRITVEEDDLIRSLRQELYVEDFCGINWPALKNFVTESDAETPQSWIMTAFYGLFNFYEKYHFTSFRKKALAEMYDLIKSDDIFTNFINSSLVLVPQTWNTTFAVQSFLEAGIQNNPEYESCLKRANAYLKSSQILDNPPNYQRYYRQMNKGGFPFSNPDNGWIICDGTGEAMKTLMLLEEKCPFIEEHVEPQQFFDAVNAMLDMRNANGGFAPYEAMHGNYLLSLMNSGDMYSDYILDRACVECTSSVMQGLKYFQKRFPDHRADEISDTLNKGLQFCRNTQRGDGGWYGTWGLCFTYGTWFALEAFACMGYTYHGRMACEEVTKACEFLVSKQMADGGWGEEFESFRHHKYIQHTISQIHHTAWALLGLMAARYPDVHVLERGIKAVIDKQTTIGDWPRQDIVTGFLKTGAVDYSSYSNIFSIFALARFVRLHPNSSVARQLPHDETGLSEHGQNERC
uniref:Terpene cyclase/mutase family member n=1 Tax=Pogona vitticeps TaxID=103695 RepID=A0A6J0U5W2_9SAUR